MSIADDVKKLENRLANMETERDDARTELAAMTKGRDELAAERVRTKALAEKWRERALRLDESADAWRAVSAGASVLRECADELDAVTTAKESK